MPDIDQRVYQKLEDELKDPKVLSTIIKDYYKQLWGISDHKINMHLKAFWEKHEIIEKEKQ